MKRLLSTFVLAAFVMAGCNQASTTKTKADSVSTTSAKFLAAPPAGAIVHETLDGLSETDALTMIENFQTSAANEIHPKTSFFIKKDMVLLLNKMLASEIAAPLTGGRHYHTDGIRIYFGKEKPTSSEIRLIVVSTTDSIVFIPPPPGIPSNPPDKMHHDYYDHLQSALHVSTVPLKISVEAENTAGALLRKPCGNCDFEPSCAALNRPGAIKRSYAEKMVKNFNGKVMTTHAVWFDAARLNEMAQGPGFAGIRIYMATYHDDSYNANGKSTFVLTTVDNIGNDYFYCESDTRSTEKGGNKVRYNSHFPPPENNGSLCPNNCN